MVTLSNYNPRWILLLLLVANVHTHCREERVKTRAFMSAFLHSASVPAILSLCFSGTGSLVCGRDPNPQTEELSFVVLPLNLPSETTFTVWSLFSEFAQVQSSAAASHCCPPHKDAWCVSFHWLFLSDIKAVQSSLRRLPRMQLSGHLWMSYYVYNY